MECGTAVVDITPEPNAELGGGSFGRAQGIQHPLTATLVLLSDGDRRSLLVSCDLIGFDNELAGELRSLLADEGECPAESVLLAATHTHTGPVTLTLNRWGRPDPAYLDRLRRRLRQGARLALANRRPVRLRYGATKVPGVARNRSSYPVPVDDDLQILALVDHRLRPVAAIVNFACHPVTMHGVGLISSDYPHYLRRGLADELGRDLPVVFLNGASGNVNPVGFAFRPDGNLLWQQRDACIDLAERHGLTLARAGASCLFRGRLVRPARLASATAEIDLPLAPYPRKRERGRLADSFRECIADERSSDWERTECRVALDWLEHAGAVRSRRTLSIPLQGLAVGPVKILAIPGEPFAHLGLALRRHCAPSPLFVATMANGYHGYLPAPEGFRRGVYEAVGVPRLLLRQCFAPECGEVLVDRAAAFLSTLALPEPVRSGSCA